MFTAPGNGELWLNTLREKKGASMRKGSNACGDRHPSTTLLASITDTPPPAGPYPPCSGPPPRWRRGACTCSAGASCPPLGLKSWKENVKGTPAGMTGAPSAAVTTSAASENLYMPRVPNVAVSYSPAAARSTEHSGRSCRKSIMHFGVPGDWTGSMPEMPEIVIAPPGTTGMLSASVTVRVFREHGDELLCAAYARRNRGASTSSGGQD
mmetsp:Transcript_22722/g.51510  ORF Transcript_22722/g.51510 Transcript_22722/m.51510 type:complete len:210 (+) Transcript_22722:3655-4284(+)